MINSEELKSIALRLQALEQEKKKISAEISDTLKQAKNAGYDNKIIKKLLKAAENPAKFQEEIELIRIYADEIQLKLF